MKPVICTSAQPRSSSFARATARRGFTLVELVICIAAIVLLTSMLAPLLSQTRRDSGHIASIANLQTLSFAQTLYAMDFNDRQPTWIPDDAGLYTTLNESTIWATVYPGCASPLLLGWDSGALGTVWGYFFGCGGHPGNSGSFPFYEPIGLGGSFTSYQSMTTAAYGAGTFRLWNAAAFSPYVDGRFYSETFYAPNDAITWDLASPSFNFPGQFAVVPPLGEAGFPQIVRTSYCLSPAAMSHPDVFSFNAATGKWYRPPYSFPTGYQSPTVSQCTYPDLKTRTLEHNWNDGAPAELNPAFANGYTPYFFNHGAEAEPLTLFFDGHVAPLPNSQVLADDAAVLAATDGAVGLWTRDTPYGATGYFGGQSFDGTIVSHHILTAGGILGRDVLGTSGASRHEARRGGTRSATRHGPAHWMLAPNDSPPVPIRIPELPLEAWMPW